MDGGRDGRVAVADASRSGPTATSTGPTPPSGGPSALKDRNGIVAESRGGASAFHANGTPNKAGLPARV